jgi:hypothetical protein
MPSLLFESVWCAAMRARCARAGRGVCGYFNVYGPGRRPHKGSMASVAFLSAANQSREHGRRRGSSKGQPVVTRPSEQAPATFVFVGDGREREPLAAGAPRSCPRIFQTSGTGASASVNDARGSAIIAGHAQGSPSATSIPARARSELIRASHRPTSRRCVLRAIPRPFEVVRARPSRAISRRASLPGR